MKKYSCPLCGFIYDEEIGYEDAIKAGTKLEDTPTGWTCPDCGKE